MLVVMRFPGLSFKGGRNSMCTTVPSLRLEHLYVVRDRILYHTAGYTFPSHGMQRTWIPVPWDHGGWQVVGVQLHLGHLVLVCSNLKNAGTWRASTRGF